MYLTPTDRHWACDIEADGLIPDATQIWCVTVLNCLTKDERHFLTKEAFLEWRKEFPDAIIVGHNALSYDAVMLNKFWGAKIKAEYIVDTFVLSQLFNPGMSSPKGMKSAPGKKKKGPHSLEAWGVRLKYEKGAFDDFSAYSETMLRYCKRDTRLAALLFRRLAERMVSVGFTERGCEIEHLAWNYIQNYQKRTGFPFDYQRAQEMYVTLRAREEELKDEIYKLWPPELRPVADYKQAFKKDGSHSKQFETHRGQFPKLEIRPDGSYQAIDWVSFDLGSPAQRVKKLLELGWQPVNLTPAGSPKVDEDELLAYAEVSGQKEVAALAKWIVINSRANMIRTWMDAYNEDTKAVHGSLFLAGTLRYRHRDPNGANIPAVRLKKDERGDEHIQYGEAGMWTYESRDLWVAGEPCWSLVGIDGTGIQTRCLIHNLIKTVGEETVKPFKDLALAGDIHKHNIAVLGLTSKAAAKKYYYSYMMGAGAKKLAADQIQFGTYLSEAEAEASKRKLTASIPGFGALIKALKKELEGSGRIKLCDGTPILVSSPHMVIPYLLQGDESRLMKQALLYVYEELSAKRWHGHVKKVADIHDEWQFKVRNEYLEEFIAMALPCFIRAGESFQYNIPITGDAKIGLTWSQTH
jgi:DNA polymerase-1